MLTKRLVQVAGLAAGAIGVVAVTTPDRGAGRAARRIAERLARDVRYAAGSAPGILYRLEGRRPDPNVSDDVLVERIRSTIGPLEKQLDTPTVNVTVDDHIAILDGEVPRECDAKAIERAVTHISGVDGVESHLHVSVGPAPATTEESSWT